MFLHMDEQYDKIYRYCYYKVKYQQIAEDLTQKTFLKFLSQKTYQNHGKPLAYLYVIAKNHCADHYRCQREMPLTDELPDEEMYVFLSIFSIVATATVLPLCYMGFKNHEIV